MDSVIQPDIRLIQHPSGLLGIGIWAQNLLNNRNPELKHQKTSLIIAIPSPGRTIGCRVTCDF